MSAMTNLANSFSRTWESVSQGWDHLISRASNSLTRFRSGEEKDGKSQALSQSPNWGLISADLYVDGDKITVRLEAPGLNNDDIEISVTDNILTICGEKQFKRETSEGEYRILECAYGRFVRSIPLGYEVDAETAKANYDQGVLKIELEKKPHQRRRQIKVN